MTPDFPLLHALAIGFAGGMGALARWSVGRLMVASGAQGPWGTVLVNLLGAFFAGVAAGWALHPAASPAAPGWLPILTLGFLGAFTTFSTWMLEVAELHAAGRPVAGALHLLGSILMGVVLAGSGLAFAALAL